MNLHVNLEANSDLILCIGPHTSLSVPPTNKKIHQYETNSSTRLHLHCLGAELVNLAGVDLGIFVTSSTLGPNMY